jgi:hypothetical protein
VELLTVEEEEEKAKTRLAELRSAHDESKPGLISSTCLAAGTGAVILQSPLVATPYVTLIVGPPAHDGRKPRHALNAL